MWLAMQVTFVLPGFSAIPVGGFGVVYEYANQLTSLGNEVTIIHPRAWLADAGRFARVRSNARAALRSILRPIPADARPAWFALDERVRSRVVSRLDSEQLPDGQVVVATSWETAAPVARLSRRKGLGFYLIQHHEHWAGPAGAVDATWRLPLHKIVISRWLLDVAHTLDPSGHVDYVPNGIDGRKYRVTRPIEDRAPRRVGMLYHTAKWKGTRDGIDALTLARKRFPTLECILFGTARPPQLPAWCSYVRSPNGDSLVDLYNTLAIFLHPSWTEGWPLPPAEAMACGCALVAAANGGVLDYAVDGMNAAMAPVQDPVRLAAALSTLLVNDAERRRIAFAGVETARSLNWDLAASRLEAVLQDGLADGGLPTTRA